MRHGKTQADYCYHLSMTLATLDQVELIAASFSSDDESNCSSVFDFPHIRDRDHRISLHCPSHNIPSIDFCNTGDDPHGRWLLATNISGDVMLWDLHEQYLVSLITIGCVDTLGLEDDFGGNATGLWRLFSM